MGLAIKSINTVVQVNGNTDTATQALYSGILGSALGSGGCTQSNFSMAPSAVQTVNAQAGSNYLMVVTPRLGDYLSVAGNKLATAPTVLLTTPSGSLSFTLSGGLLIFTDVFTSVRITHNDVTLGNDLPVTLIMG